MKTKKRLTILLCFCLGAALFMGTAFADVLSKEGYDQFKDAIKDTVAAISEGYDSYTAELAYSIKDNDKLLMLNTEISKRDLANGKAEDISTEEYGSGKKPSYYYYEDTTCSIHKNSDDNSYYMYEYEKEKEVWRPENPFKEEEFEGIEQIFDALIGNLKNHVIVKENNDGTKEFSGTISDNQIPALINAVTSYLFKQTVSDYGLGNEEMIPYLKDDVFINSVSGNASVNKDGVIDNLFASFILNGKDEDGVEHELTFEMVIKLYNFNSTTITKPDLTGKKVEKNTIKNYPKINISNKYLGKWKNDIVIDENNSFIKIGERFIEITSIDEQYIYGKYYEEYKEEYAEYAADKKEFEFKVDAKDDMSRFEGINTSDDSVSGFIWFEGGYIEFFMDNDTRMWNQGHFNRQYNRVFEE
ncbi:MAG: hypothetical protein GX383_08480 [Clostridium sp.]|jgi:hypothetical protein|nr:hypothetical protein [Clostridium sp.]